MKHFWSLAAGIALGVICCKVTTSGQLKETVEACRVKCINAIDKAIEATS